jgi:hypothetical protein
MSHPPTALVEFVAVDNRLDVSTSSGEMVFLKKLTFWCLGDVIATASTVDTTGAGIALDESKKERISVPHRVFGTKRVVRRQNQR